MDYVEDATEKYLVSLNCGAVEYEPCGPTTFPDFSVAGTIGVECTRLVHMLERRGKTYNATEMEPRIVHGLESAIESVSLDDQATSMFVSVQYRIDIDTKASFRQLRRVLKKFENLPDSLPHREEVNESLTIHISPASRRHETTFQLGAIANLDSAGWVLDKLISQINDAFVRKADTLHLSHDRFDEWWLSVSSHLTAGVTDEYLDILRTEIRPIGSWDKLILIDPFRPEHSRTLKLV